MKIIHFATDEKFINSAYEIFEKALPKNNKFVILLDSPNSDIKYLNKKKRYTFIYKGKSLVEDFTSKIDPDAKLIIYHGLNNFNAAKIALSPRIQKFHQCWLVFGAEVYMNPFIFDRAIYGTHTYFRYVLFSKRKIRDYLWNFLKAVGIQNNYINNIKAMQKMKYVGILYEEEFNLYQELGLLNDSAEIMKFTYYPANLIIKDKTNLVSSNNILLGNSASFSNNHLEALYFLKNVELNKTQKIIVPLSYGGTNGYIQSLVRQGKKMFGNQFVELTEFMPLSEYQKILQTCGIVIMNHFRQQAIGNILNTLLLGAKVYLSEKSTFFHFLKRLGCYIYSLETSSSYSEKIVLENLEEEKVEINRAILLKELNFGKICSELQNKLKQY